MPEHDQFIRIHSSTEALGNVKGERLTDEILRFTDGGHFTVYAEYAYAVAVGELDSGRFTLGFSDRTPDKAALPLEHLQALRVFNENAELRAVRTKEEYCVRIRRDGDGATCEVVDLPYKVLGEADVINGKTVMSNREGAYIPIPFKCAQHEKLALIVRNYVEFPAIPISEDDVGSTGLMLFADSRFVKLIPWNEKNEHREVE